MIQCDWCQADSAQKETNTVYWELPDGTRAIEITETPCITCPQCGMEYQDEQTIKEIDDQLFLIDRTKLNKSVSYEQLMNMERLLKRNYFDYS